MKHIKQFSLFEAVSNTLTKEQYDYLLPVFGNSATKQLLSKTEHGVEKYYFIGTHEEYLDALNRCKYLK